MLISIPSSFAIGQKDVLRKPEKSNKYSLHWQTTVIPQYHFKFNAPYSGQNSLQPIEPVMASFSVTAFLNFRIGSHAYIVFNPEAVGGKGLSQTMGIAGFPNGEVYRVGDPNPKPFIARLYLEKRFPLSSKMEKVDDDLNQIKETTNQEYLSLIIGKFSLTDFFDNSQISHDPRTQFMNWSLMGNGAWDYPANTRGYTIGVVIQAVYGNWAVRSAITTVPIEANGPELQFSFGKAMGLVWELERTHLFWKDTSHYCTLHAGTFLNYASMGNYTLSLQKAGNGSPDIADSREYGRKKWGFYASMDNHIGRLHHFLKISWNDGNNETWAFTEIDRSLAIGIQWDGILGKRKTDKLAFAFVNNGLADPHKSYLQKGGYGFMIGDGKLEYASEQICELYYSIPISSKVFISPDYQYIINPAYNSDRGPVHIIALRLHASL